MIKTNHSCCAVITELQPPASHTLCITMYILLHKQYDLCFSISLSLPSPFSQVPTQVKELHYEVELGVVIGKEGRDIPESSAMSHVGGYTVALDMTSRGHQAQAKKKGHPWTVSKGFDTFCPVSSFIEKERLDPFNCKLWLKVSVR